MTKLRDNKRTDLARREFKRGVSPSSIINPPLLIKERGTKGVRFKYP